MILARTAGRIWILDHLAPIQELRRGRRRHRRRLFTPPPSAMFRRPARDRNYEFWGDQTSTARTRRRPA